MRRLEIGADELAAVERRALDAFPEECCGLLLGHRAGAGANRVVALAPCENRARGSRRRRFTIGADALLAAYRRARATGQEIVGTFHSHTDGPAEPSRRDLESAWPGASYLIVALGPGGVGERRSWRLAGSGRFVEEELRPAPRRREVPA
jgi:proteasome lid subunit RPN8/RPN11